MKTQFKGRLIKTSYNFLIGDYGKEFLEEYNGKVKSDYKDNSNLKVLNFKEGVVKGSNSHSIFLANEILEKQGLRTLTPRDAQSIINKDKNFLRGIYADLGLVLRTENNTNEYLAKQLGKQAKEREYEFSSKIPLVFKASDLKLILDENSNSGLGFKIKESADPFNAPELSNKNSGKTFITTNEYGMPIFNKNEDRINYTKDNGLSRFSLGRGSDLYSRNDDLVSSSDVGRVVVVKDAEKRE